MIAIFMNTMEDTDTFAPLFNSIDCTLLTNPTKAEVIKVLEENPTETLMCLGHGSHNGLFSSDWGEGYVIDFSMVHLLKDREIIGIWCYASDFARRHNLKGFFTYMFISNISEAKCHGKGVGATDELIYEENVKFSNIINEYITNGTPLDKWVDLLYENCNHELPFVEYNYSHLSYFDGTDNESISSLLEEINEEYFQPSLFTEFHDEPLLCFAETDKIADYLYEKYGEYGDTSVDSLTDDEFLELSTYQYTIEEYVVAFNDGVTPNNRDYYMRRIS
jgi:hypothetical protein